MPQRALLGFSVRVYGRDLPSYDARAWPDLPSLSVSLAYLRDILLYLQANDIRMYRMHARVLPYSHERTAAELAREVAWCGRQLATVGDLTRESRVRLGVHPYGIAVLNAPNEEQAESAARYVEGLANMMEAMGLGPEAVIVLHVGGVYDSVSSSRERFIRRYDALPDSARLRVALEQDDHRFSHADTRLIHERTGVRLVFDNLHHAVLNPEGIPASEALAYALNTWPPSVRPKVHFATPCTEMRRLAGSARIKAPTWTEHSDYVNPFAFIGFARETAALRPFDIMLEAKARDLALLKLRDDLNRFAPDVASRIR